MAEMKQLQCREHGGTFFIPPRRGRPPVRCSEENPCDMVKARNKGRQSAPEIAKAVSRTRKGATPKPARDIPTPKGARGHQVAPQKATKTRPEASPAVVRHNPSIVFAHKAKEQLEPLGWNLKGRQWVDEDESAWAEVTGTRGEETIALRWVDGKFDSQDYSLWDADKSPGQNNRPKSRLPFDPNEMTDEELARELSGRRVTWWNRIASNTETAIIGDKLKIEHTYTGGNETARQIHFVDATPNHGKFRAFNVDALMRVK